MPAFRRGGRGRRLFVQGRDRDVVLREFARGGARGTSDLVGRAVSHAGDRDRVCADPAKARQNSESAHLALESGLSEVFGETSSEGLVDRATRSAQETCCIRPDDDDVGGNFGDALLGRDDVQRSLPGVDGKSIRPRLRAAG